MAFIAPTPIISRSSFTPTAAARRRPIRRGTAAARARNARIPAASISSPSPLPDTASSTDQSPAAPFNWIDQWYPVAYARDVPTHTPFPFTLWDKPLVLYRDVQKRFVIMDDRCPHRAAPLSEGRLFNRKTDGPDSEEETILQCAYHGWCFNCSGTCVDIPTVAKEKAIPKAANIPKTYAMHVGPGELIFVWFGDADKADMSKLRIPKVLRSNDPAQRVILYRRMSREVPLDLVTNLENLIDPAHVQFTHHGTGQGNRAWMSRLSGVTVLSEQDEGIIRGGIIRPRRNESDPIEYRTEVDFEAPSFISYYTPFRKGGHQMVVVWQRPVSRSKSVLFPMAIKANLPKWLMFRQSITPEWWEHMKGNLILDGDTYLLQLQEKNVQDAQQQGYGDWRQKYIFAAGEWDTAVIALRKWIDKHASTMPYDSAAGYAPVADPKREVSHDRFENHTKNCLICTRALRRFRMLRLAMLILAAMTAWICLTAMVLYVSMKEAGINTGALITTGVASLLVGIVAVAVARLAQWFVEAFVYTERAKWLHVTQ